MSKRVVGVVLLAVLALMALAGGASAVEEAGGPAYHERPSIDEVGTQSETAREFFPEPWEAPSVFAFLAWPLLAIGVLAVAAILFLYLVWQPRFAAERRGKNS